MPRPIDLVDIADKNPRVNLKELEEGRKVRENLRRTNLRGANQRLAFPFHRRRARIVDDVASDPRVIRLHKSEK
jgi:hypothetical protein